MKRMAIILLSILGATVIGCKSNNGTAGGSGFIEANEVLVSAETGGRVIERRFDEGQSVKAGDTLAVIDPSRTELELASAEAGHQTAEANLRVARIQVDRAKQQESYTKSERDRIARLIRSGSATQRQLDQLENEFTQATIARKSAEATVGTIEAEIEKINADLNRIRRVLQDTRPLAPISGTVTEKFVDAGEVVGLGKAIIKIAQLDTVWAKVYLPSSEFSGVKVGDRAKVSTESGETEYPGVVSWTSAEAEFTPKNVQTEKSRANLVYAVKVTIPNSDGRLKIGMPVFVTLELK